ncbi:MAG: recombination-associated protein RdgC [Thiogranum sp.]|nr:recombination-associated protein RdgC [Thiogranum sp.]
MWFRNLRIYLLQQPFNLTADDLDQALQDAAFRACGPLQTHAMGWEPPLGREGQTLVHAANGCLMVCARREERLLPASVVREVLADKVAEIEDAESRHLGRKEKADLRDQITTELMPQAFTRSTRLFAYIDPRQQLLFVDSASAPRAEDLVSLLRESLGSFPVRPLDTAAAPPSVLTSWVAGEAPADFTLMDECELREPAEGGGVVRCKQVDLASTEVETHLAAGRRVVRLAIEWNEQLSCVLSDDLVIRRLRFLDLIQQQADDAHSDDAAANFDAEFSILNAELSRFVPRLIEVMGGLPEE